MCLHMASADRLNDDGHYPDQHFVVRTFRNRGVELDVQLRRCRAVDLAAVHFRHQQLEVPDVLGCGPLAGQACDLRFNQHTRLKQILDQLLLIGEMQSQGVFPNARSRAHKGSAPLPDYNHILRSQELHGFPKCRPADAKKICQLLLCGKPVTGLHLPLDNHRLNFLGSSHGKYIHILIFVHISAH